MSSSSMLCEEIALAKAAFAAGTRTVSPISVDSAFVPEHWANMRAAWPLSVWLPAIATPR